MIVRIFLNLAVFGVSIFAICYGTKLNTNEAEARIFLNQTSDKLFSSYDEIANIAFNDIDDSYDEHEAYKNYSKFMKQIFDDSRKFDIKNFKDDELKHAFKMLDRDTGEYIIGEERYSELFLSLQELNNLQKDNIIEEYGDSNTKLAYYPDIVKIFQNSKDSAELQYYWSAWREVAGQWADKNFKITIEALKDAAHLSGLSPFEFWSQGINITDMEKLMTKIQPLYLELHAFIRKLLQKKYGESIIAPDGLIPGFLFEQILQQSWSNERKDTLIKEMFPHKNLPRVELKKFKGNQLYDIADNFFENLGFEKYPSGIWGDRIKMIEFGDDLGECQSRLWLGTPNIHLEFCEKLNTNFLEAYENLAYIYYAKEMVGLPAYYFKSPVGLNQAIAKAIHLSSSTHHNLKAIGIIPDFNTTHEVEMNRLLRMAINNLLNVPINLVNAKVMGDVVSGNIKTSELSSHYWYLMGKYAGVGPPKDYKSHTLIDLPSNFYEEIYDNDMSRDFISEILGFQIYKKLCELSEKYPKEPLHLCDISGSKEAGNALKKMMRLGSSKPFNEVLASMFPENPTVMAEGLLEYYNPIKDFLVKKNKEADVKSGWKTSNSDKS